MVFLLIHIVPGDPVVQMLGEGARPAREQLPGHQVAVMLHLGHQDGVVGAERDRLPQRGLGLRRPHAQHADAASVLVLEAQRLLVLAQGLRHAGGRLGEFDRQVERRLPAHRREDGVGALLDA